MADGDKLSSLFSTTIRRTRKLTDWPMGSGDMGRMVKCRMRLADIPARLSPLSFRVTTITGSWHIVPMSAGEDEAPNEEGRAFIEFDEEGVGKFQFGNIQGLTDHYRSKKRDGKRIAQFSWDGEDVDGTPLEGIGWVILEGGELSGTISIHLGDDLQFVAKRAKQHRVGGEEES